MCKDHTGDYLPLINTYTSSETFTATSSDAFRPCPTLSLTGFLVQVISHLATASPISFQLSYEEPKSNLKPTFLHKIKGEEGMVVKNVKENSLEIKIGYLIRALIGI